MEERDAEELERYRRKAKRLQNYNNQYMKEAYKRLLCLLPKGLEAAFNEARGDEPVSTYINRLIAEDIERKGISIDVV